MKEQGEALGNKRNKKLAIDLGKIIGADEVITGELTKIGKSFGRVTLTIRLNITEVKSGNITKKIEYTHKFDRSVNKNRIQEKLKSVAKELVKNKF